MPRPQPIDQQVRHEWYAVDGVGPAGEHLQAVRVDAQIGNTLLEARLCGARARALGPAFSCRVPPHLPALNRRRARRRALGQRPLEVRRVQCRVPGRQGRPR